MHLNGRLFHQRSERLDVDTMNHGESCMRVINDHNYIVLLNP